MPSISGSVFPRLVNPFFFRDCKWQWIGWLSWALALTCPSLSQPQYFPWRWYSNRSMVVLAIAVVLHVASSSIKASPKSPKAAWNRSPWLLELNVEIEGCQCWRLNHNLLSTLEAIAIHTWSLTTVILQWLLNPKCHPCALHKRVLPNWAHSNQLARARWMQRCMCH